jgi:hydrogenase/urease accessory protein HupE
LEEVQDPLRGGGSVKSLGLLLVASWLALFGRPSSAHEMTIAEMELRESMPGEFSWTWTATSDARSVELDLVPEWPEGCHAEARLIHCGPAGLTGPLTVNGVGKRYSAVMIKIDWRDGQTRVYTLTGNTPTVRLYGSADDKRGIGEIAQTYTVLGVEHILTGYDHLAFVLGLLFLVGFQRKLIWTITAFTFAHSLTLASAALGILTLRPPPVELCIALSIVLVANEAVNDRETLARRFPAFLAFLFGLVHGLGFAGALKEIGLPQAHLPIALLTFNLGVEMGQLLTVAVCYGIYRLLPRNAAWLPRARLAALYGIGTLAAFWSLSRFAVILAKLHV